MRARLIGWSEAEAGFDLCPWVLRRKIWSQGRSRTATHSTLHQRDDWTHACWATPEPDGTIVVTNGEDEREQEQEGEGEKLGNCVLIDLWSERFCPLICKAEEKGLRCFWISLFGFRIPVHSHQELFHHLTPEDLQLPSPVVRVMHRALQRPKANQCSTRDWYRSY